MAGIGSAMDCQNVAIGDPMVWANLLAVARSRSGKAAANGELARDGPGELI